MNRITMTKRLQMVLVALLAAMLLFGILAAPHAQASSNKASDITLREDLTHDYTQYLDSSKMYQLPSGVSDDQQISVIITVDAPNLMDAYEEGDKIQNFSDYAQTTDDAEDIIAAIASEKDRILSQLDELQIEYTTGKDYSVLLSGFEIEILARDFDAVCQSLGEGEGTIVSEVYNVAETQLVENPVNIYTETGIFYSGDSGYDGSGMVVAVLDTGLDSNHSAFSVDNFTSQKLGLTYEDVAAVLDQTLAYEQSGGLSVDDVYINEKVPFGYDYADNDPDPYSTHNNHGTHVSGVIAGKDDVITGVAPNAQLVSMKVFSDVMDTARASWILSALEDCVVLGVDVINMSLGTACGFARESDEEVLSGVYDKIREAGISVVVAASNSYSSAYGSEANGNLPLTSNPDTGTVGSPGTYEGTLSVASINGEETPYILYNKTIMYFDETNTGAAEENDFFETLLGEEDSIEIEFVVIPGVGRTADYTGMNVEGKIALVRRGDNTFEEKAMIAESQGARGIIIYNNVSGDVKMNVGEAKLASCSISQDDGEMLAATGGGKLKISKEQTSGPFISDFSSWGPTPSLEIKPELTAHGGNILSAVTGGSYDRMSGTSMACPNLAGVVVLMRQYVVENFPDIADDNVAVSAMVNRLLMSTADIANNTNGLPYAVRKQGAGLANLMNSINTTAYITTYDADGNAMDKTKLELGDDPEKTGVYEMSFTVANFGEKTLAYDIGAYVMTEGVSETKTNAGETTVTEEAYMLEGAQMEIVSVEGGKLSGTKLTVNAGEEADVTVKITLSEEDKAYLDASFVNGMYVEGYITLTATKGTDVDMSVPYLAFYGDWTVAPLFDLTYYDTNADELDEGLDEEDKLKADAYSTRPIGGVEDDFVSYLGSYYFLQDPDDMVIAANENYIALSNTVGSVHSLRFVWAGLLRNAERIEIVITNDTTGEVVFETVDDMVRKSYGDGGSIYPANIEIEFDTQDYNLPNNSQYTVTLTGYLDYGEDGGIDTNEKNTFTFPLTIDFEAPTVTDVEYYYEYDKTLEKNRLYAKVSIYDNHYAMASQLGYVGTGTDENGNEVPELMSFSHYMTPVYSQCNSTTVVTFELTDYIYEIKANAVNKNTFVVTTYDYALNYATYEISLPDDLTDFYFEGLEDGLTLSPNEVYTLSPLVYPETEWGEMLEITSSKPSVVRVVNDKLVACASGSATIRVREPQSGKSVTFSVKVLKEDDEGYRRYDKPVADTFELRGYTTQKAYYVIDNNDQDIGETGQTRFFEGDYSLALYPSETVLLNYVLDPYFPKDTEVVFESANENIVTVDDYGNVVGVAEGFSSVTIKVLMDGKSTYYSQSVTVEVKDPYLTSGATLTHYYGNGGLVTVPADLRLQEIGAFAFANFEYVLKTEEELAFDDAETSKQWYIGDNTITKVVLPEGIEKINQYAFANLTSLEEIVLPSTLESIEYGAFYGCSSLAKITFSGENNLKIISQSAFESCNLQGTIDLSSICVISNYAFAGNQELEGVITGDTLLSIGEYAFASCKDLKDFTITAKKVKYGPYAFTDCESLTEFYVNAAVLPEGMFYQAESLKKVTIGPDVNDIGEFAFRDTAVDTFVVEAGNKAYTAQSADHVLSADGKTLYAVAATLRGEFSAKNLGGASVTAIGKGAFSHNTKLTAINLPTVTTIGNYGLGSAESIEKVTFGQLTQIGEYAFFETSITELPSFTAETKVGKYAFAFTDIVSVTVPDNMTVAEGVFSQCMDLQSVTIGNNVTLEAYAFNMDKDESFSVANYNEDGEKYFYYVFSSALTELTIGDNVVIGDNAFAGHASLEAVSLGAGAKLGYMAFYNCSSLKEIDLSKVTAIGDYALSGDVYYICLDESMSVAAVSTEGTYMYTYHAPAIEKAELLSVTELGEYAFSYCRDMTEVVLNDAITELPQYVFAGCETLQTIDLSKIVTLGDYAFIEGRALTNVDLSAAESIGAYAFVYCYGLESVTLNPSGSTVAEGAFAYCENLTKVQNMAAVTEIDSYAFSYTALTGADLTGAVKLGDYVFMKEELTPFKVTLGTALESLGDNPFALCQIEPFCQTETVDFNGTKTENKNYTYTLSDTVQVIEGSLYCQTANGLELICYANPEHENVKIADDTVRIAGMAFAGSDIQRVTLPYTTTAIGHKAFYLCQDLEMVVFGSYYAPILEEEFDPSYYETLEHIPGTGEFGEYTDYDGEQVIVNGMSLLPYYMWNATDGMYSNIFYGASFVDYLGYVEDKLVMVRPANGEQYDSFVLSQYFDTVIDGAKAPDDNAVAAINAIKAIPEKVSYEQKDIVEAARAAYEKIATLEQKALVTNYADLVSAEQRVAALDPNAQPAEGEENTDETSAEEPKNGVMGGVMVCVLVVVGLLACGVANFLRGRKHKAAAPVAEAEEMTEEATEEVTEEAAEETTEEATEEATEEEISEEVTEETVETAEPAQSNEEPTE